MFFMMLSSCRCVKVLTCQGAMPMPVSGMITAAARANRAAAWTLMMEARP
jgi:hypothetical protein